MKLIVPHPLPAQQFNSQHQSHASVSSSAGYSYQNHNNQAVQIIHDCGKGPQLSQSYGTPLGQPLETYGTPSALEGLSGNYEIPSGGFEVPQHNSIDFNSPSNSYGPPASGPASLDVIGLESQHRANTIVSSEQQNLVASASQVSNEVLPGLSSGLSGSGLNFISAHQSHAIEVPTGGEVGHYQLQFTQSHSDHGGNRVDSPNHQQILADGLLQSILTAIEKQPSQTMPQVTEEQEHDHSEVQVFLKSPEGQVVLADKPASSSEHSS